MTFYSENKSLIQEINRNFLIRVYENKKRKLVGAGRITKYIPEQVALDTFNSILDTTKEKVT